ncbi:MAG: nitrophenyl compound nitroreductase subunit ArsF family protein [Candidatus Aceula meridiana]|nr:nitrophenyl compound nitroreductase subunit ArsF family protein [Candidatus Aceula meridiana]
MKKASVLVLILLTFLSFDAFGQEQSADKIVVYYFHGDFRCQTCMTIEQQTKEAIFQNYKAELDEGKIEVKVVNYDIKENKHFKKDYGLFTKSVVLSLVQGGQETSFNNLQDVWQLVRNKEQFGEYIKSETQKYLDMLSKEEK